MESHLKYLDKCPACNSDLRNISNDEYLEILDYNEFHEQANFNCPICEVLIVFKLWIG